MESRVLALLLEFGLAASARRMSKGLGFLGTVRLVRNLPSGVEILIGMKCLLVDVSGAFLGVRLVAEFAFERADIHVESHVLLHCFIICVSLEAYRALRFLHLLLIPFSWNPFGKLFNKIRAPTKS